jgi:hypothetical protein
VAEGGRQLQSPALGNLCVQVSANFPTKPARAQPRLRSGSSLESRLGLRSQLLSADHYSIPLILEPHEFSNHRRDQQAVGDQVSLYLRNNLFGSLIVGFLSLLAAAAPACP